MNPQLTGVAMVVMGILLFVARREWARLSVSLRGMSEWWYRPALWLTTFVAACLVAFGSLQVFWH